MDQMLPYVWIGIAALLAIVEVATVQLVSIWFVVAGVVTAVSAATFFNGNLLCQAILFVLVSVLCLLATRPLVKKLKATQKVKTNADRFIGRTGKVIADIGNNTYSGQVVVDGKKWSALSKNGEEILQGTDVKIEAIEGVRLIVSPNK